VAINNIKNTSEYLSWYKLVPRSGIDWCIC